MGQDLVGVMSMGIACGLWVLVENNCVTLEGTGGETLSAVGVDNGVVALEAADLSGLVLEPSSLTPVGPAPPP